LKHLVLGVSAAADGVNLIDEDDARRVRLCLLEQVPHAPRAHAHVHLQTKAALVPVHMHTCAFTSLNMHTCAFTLTSLNMPFLRLRTPGYGVLIAMLARTPLRVGFGGRGHDKHAPCAHAHAHVHRHSYLVSRWMHHTPLRVHQPAQRSLVEA
jgi:hypothetical protein